MIRFFDLSILPTRPTLPKIIKQACQHYAAPSSAHNQKSCQQSLPLYFFQMRWLWRSINSVCCPLSEISVDSNEQETHECCGWKRFQYAMKNGHLSYTNLNTGWFKFSATNYCQNYVPVTIFILIAGWSICERQCQIQRHKICRLISHQVRYTRTGKKCCHGNFYYVEPRKVYRW